MNISSAEDGNNNLILAELEKSVLEFIDRTLANSHSDSRLVSFDKKLLPDCLICAVDIQSSVKSKVFIRFEKNTIDYLVRKIFEYSGSNLEHLIKDGAIEITNMIFGILKSKLSPLEIELGYGIPKIIQSRELFLQIHETETKEDTILFSVENFYFDVGLFCDRS